MMAMGLLAGRYELVARIGVGGYGEVWRGQDSVLARPVAIKLLQAEHTVVPEAMMRFRAEARHAGALSHPCIAHVYDYCEPAAPDPPFLVMELVDGMSLAEVLTRGPLDLARAMDVIGQAASGLSAAHQAGLVHRDIKPGNLLISRGGPVKITDFGIAQAQVPAASGPVTMTGMVLGTAGYMAPERVEGNQATVASDLYALGVVAHECLAGLLPRGAAGLRSGEATLDQPALAPLAPRTAPLPPLPAGIPPDVAALVGRLTARDPARRPASAGEVARQAAALRDRYRDAAQRPGAAGGPARDAAADDTAWDNAVEDGAARDRTPLDGAVRNGAGPDRTAVDGAVRDGAALTDRSRAGQEPATGPDASPGGRDGAPGRRVRPSRMVLAIVMAAVIGLALLTFGVLEVIHQRGAATVASPSSVGAGAGRTVDLRESALVGEPLSTVRSQLRRDGLRVRVLLQISSLRPGQVLRVLPSGKVRVGSVVTVIVAQASSVPTSPTSPSGQLPPPDHGILPTVKPTLSASPSASPDTSPSPSVSPSSPPASPSGSPSPTGSPSPSTSPTGGTPPDPS
jgi:eukaryotic-like serine/threonine-protein kinase